MNLVENLDRTARARGRFTAVVLGDTVTSFDEVARWSRRVAGFLAAHGVGAGDRVALVLPDVAELASLHYGVLRLGAVVVPLSPALNENELRQRLRDAGASAVVAWSPGATPAEQAGRALGLTVWTLQPGRLPELLDGALPHDAVEPRTDDDIAVVAFTAGRSGDPRAARLTHGNVARTCEVVVNDLLQLTSDDVVLAGLPLSHLSAQTGLHAAVRAGACLVLLDPIDGATTMQALGEHGVTVLVGRPETFAALLRQPTLGGTRLPRLRVGVCGGAALPVDVLLGFEEAFDCRVLENYGLAETSSLASSNFLYRRRVGSIGVAVNGVDLRVVDGAGSEVDMGQPGQIVVRGHAVMAGYVGHPEATAATLVEGWLHTGDTGLQDEDGFFHVVAPAAPVAPAPGAVPARATRLETPA